MLAQQTPITMHGQSNTDSADKQLRAIWARIIAEGEEGLVLKADEGGYNDYQSPWVKVRSFR
jgi:DNA ligase-4